MSKPRILPFGTWESPIGADALARSGVRLGFPSFDREGSLFWVETRPAEQGRSVLVQRASDGTFHDLTPASLSVRSRVHEYGGMSYLIFGSEFFVVNFSDQQIWRVAGNSAPTPLTSAPEFRFAEMSMDAARRRLIAVGERHGTAREPQNLIVIIELSSGKVGALVTGRDFYAAPALSPDGKELAFLAWDHPHMPWDAAELWVADLDSGGSVQGMQHIAGGPEGSAFQPGWSNAGLLYFSLEVDGFWNLHRWMDQRVTRVMDLSAELGAPLWQLGTRVWDFHGKDTVGACFRNGLSELLRFHSDGQIESISRDWAHVGQLACSGDYLALIVGWAGGGSELALLNLATGKAETVRNAYLGLLLPEDTSVAEAVTFPTGDGELAHGFFYAPRNHGFAGPDGARPPLVVTAHGGPTACATPTFSPTVQFWTTRGFAVLDVNYRGSSGYGRAYRERLREQWGIFDVEDCVAGARYLADEGRVDAQRLCIRGGSAGGYTVLQALAHHDVFAAGSCHYGISDLEALVRDTHKFESRYDRFLVGPYPERRDLFVERSPIHYPERIRRPIVFFQGLEDKVVPPAQTEGMAEVLRARGLDAEYHAYPGEQHGFRKAETIRHVLETELGFFRRVLKLSS